MIFTARHFESEYRELIRFFPAASFVGGVRGYVDLQIDGKEPGDIGECYSPLSRVAVGVRLSENNYSFEHEITAQNRRDYVNCVKRACKVSLYKALAEFTGIKLPYGSLTGIRPTKLYRETLNLGVNAEKYFNEYLMVSPHKTRLIKEVVGNQLNIIEGGLNEINLFVNIPICTSRCSYCSFISAEKSRISRLITPYAQQLTREIEHALQLINSEGYDVRSIYVGGGTPTSLDLADLERIFITLKSVSAREFTVEAGRPDTIDVDKLKLFKECGVNRISVNPQTFNQKTLDVIGRKHSVNDIYSAYESAHALGFSVNTDLIAMLPGESPADFAYSVRECVKLSPDDITVHTLSLKRGSTLTQSNYGVNHGDLAAEMTEFAYHELKDANYIPYYMYRQKYTEGNQENVGYSRRGKECVYNVDIMEETKSIIACGAGGISKRIYPHNRLERLANVKGIDVYLERETALLGAKSRFFAK